MEEGRAVGKMRVAVPVSASVGVIVLGSAAVTAVGMRVGNGLESGGSAHATNAVITISISHVNRFSPVWFMGGSSRR